jgi:hypothetical protein
MACEGIRDIPGKILKVVAMAKIQLFEVNGRP